MTKSQDGTNKKQTKKKKKQHNYCKCVLLNKGVLFHLKGWAPLGVLCHNGAVISSLAMMLISWFQHFPIASGYLPVRHCPTASRVAASTPSGHPRHCPTASRVAASTPSGGLRQSTTNPTTTFTQSPPRWKEPLLPT